MHAPLSAQVVGGLVLLPYFTVRTRNVKNACAPAVDSFTVAGGAECARVRARARACVRRRGVHARCRGACGTHTPTPAAQHIHNELDIRTR